MYKYKVNYWVHPCVGWTKGWTKEWTMGLYFKGSNFKAKGFLYHTEGILDDIREDK